MAMREHAGMSKPNPPDDATLIALARHIETHAEEALPLAALAARTGLSPSRLQKRFVALFGVSPKQFQDQYRLRRLKAGLRNGDTVTTAIVDAGFGSSSRVYGETHRQLGMPLARYRAGAPGEDIAYAYRSTPLGGLLMAATLRGVCFAQFGDSEAFLLSLLQSEFPKASLHAAGPDDAQLDSWMEALQAHLAEREPAPQLPLDLRGTAFQIKVWRFLLGLAAGETTSYAQLATGIGNPAAVRAAASACAANRIAVLVPCHRVLRGDGSLGGYRWGLERKAALLRAERPDQPASKRSITAT